MGYYTQVLQLNRGWASTWIDDNNDNDALFKYF